MTEEEVKLKSLELAVELKTGSTADGENIVKIAKEFMSFLLDNSKAKEYASNSKSGNHNMVASKIKGSPDVIDKLPTIK